MEAEPNLLLLLPGGACASRAGSRKAVPRHKPFLHAAITHSLCGGLYVLTALQVCVRKRKVPAPENAQSGGVLDTHMVCKIHFDCSTIKIINKYINT